MAPHTVSTCRPENEEESSHIATLRGELPDGSRASGCDTRNAVPGKYADLPPFTPAAYANPLPCGESVMPPSAEVVVPSKEKARMGVDGGVRVMVPVTVAEMEGDEVADADGVDDGVFDDVGDGTVPSAYSLPSMAPTYSVPSAPIVGEDHKREPIV